MLRLEISSIDKDNRKNVYEQIKYIGGKYAGARWRLSVTDAIKLMERNKYSFYVSCGGHEVDVVIATLNGIKYLKTEVDGVTPAGLLFLSECEY